MNTIRHTTPRVRRGTGRAAGVSVALISALALLGCTATGAADKTPGTSPTATDGGSAAAQTVKIDEAQLTDTFNSMAAEYMASGAGMLVRSADGEFTAVYGVTEMGGSIPVSVDDHVRIGSNTKTWTGTVILQLAEEGKIATDDPVSKYRPDVPNGDNITIADLLNMRSGLFNYTETYELNRTMDEDPEKVWDPEALVAMGLALPPYFEPDKGYHYSNTNTLLLGLIAEKLDGKPIQQIYQERLFDPLGMKQTSYPAADDTTMPEPYSHGYYYGTNVMTIWKTKLPYDMQAEARAGTLLPADVTNNNPSWTASAGMGISTLGDLATWVEALGKGEALGADMQAQRMATLDLGSGGIKYGWGMANMGGFLGHTGELPGYNTFMGYDPVNDITVVTWSSLAPAADGQPVAVNIARAVIAQMFGKELPVYSDPDSGADPVPAPESK